MLAVSCSHPSSHALTTLPTLTLRNPLVLRTRFFRVVTLIVATNLLGVNTRFTDFTKRNGMGGESVYGSPFADEDLSHELDSQGYVAQRSSGSLPCTATVDTSGHLRHRSHDSSKLVTHLSFPETDASFHLGWFLPTHSLPPLVCFVWRTKVRTRMAPSFS
jgi:hypothetical protein